MQLDFNKMNGLVPCIIQNAITQEVLMLGYMNKEALEKTLQEKVITFFSRSKNRLWTKGETSGNMLELVNIREDCDQDSLIAQVLPKGPTCHLGNNSCFQGLENKGELYRLESTLQERIDNPSTKSYTTSLLNKGINKVAQKVGEEAVELIIEAKDDNKELFVAEAADLMYHYLLLLKAKGSSLKEIEDELNKRASRRS